MLKARLTVAEIFPHKREQCIELVLMYNICYTYYVECIHSNYSEYVESSVYNSVFIITTGSRALEIVVLVAALLWSANLLMPRL